MSADHSKVEVNDLGNITAMVDAKGNPISCDNWGEPYAAKDRCPAYARYIDRRVSRPTESPRDSARWANDWPASWSVKDPLPPMGEMTTGTGFIQTGRDTFSMARQIEDAQRDYPPVVDRPTFVLCLIIVAAASTLAGLIAGAWMMS